MANYHQPYNNSGLITAPRLISTAVLVVLMSFGIAWADKLVPLKLQRAILIKVLAYERRLGQSKEDLVIGIVGWSNSSTSISVQSSMFKGFKAMGEVKVKSRNVAVVKVDVENLAAGGAQVLYIPPGLDKHISQIVQYARREKIVTVTGVPEYIPKGLSVGVLPKGNRSQIVINLPAAKAEGADFSSHLLRVAEVIKD